MEFAAIGGVRLAYDLRGSDENGTVVLAGGTGMPPLVWDMCGLSTALKDSGYRVLTYSARGVAPSDAPPPPYSIGDLADDLAGLLESLGIADCDLVGYSLGGCMAELLVRQRPDLIRNAVFLAGGGRPGPVAMAMCDTEAEMIATLGYLPPPWIRFMELVTSLPSSVLRDDTVEVAKWWELLSAHDASWTSADGTTGQSAAGTDWVRDTDRIARLSEISVPVLVVCFEHDLFFPPKTGRATAAAIPRGKFIEIPDAAHGGLITHSAQCHSAIGNFLSAG
jgi:pimeloyl-ACP methyl ester carboxylesterase